MKAIRRVSSGVPEGGQFTAVVRQESAVSLGRRSYEAPQNVDPEWFARLAGYQQRDLVDEGVLYIEDAGGDPVEVTPGIVDENADWVFKRGQCLALAVVAAEECGGKVYCQRVDFDDVDEAGRPFYSLKHAYVLTPDGVLIDIQGEHGAPEDLALDDDDPEEPIDAITFDDPRAALAHFDGYLVDQQTVVAEPFAKRILAEHRAGASTGEFE